MKTVTKVCLYLAGLAVVFAGAWAIGAAAAPLDTTPPMQQHKMVGAHH
jgi:hypothetical protein